jgi:transcriptional regulator of acetoin/glycerol metabolism
LAPETRTALLRANWPGNVRELRQAIERACALAKESVLHVSDLPEAVQLPVASLTPGTSFFAPVPLSEVEKTHILKVLEYCAGNKKAAAEVLEIDRSTLYAKLRQYGVH